MTTYAGGCTVSLTVTPSPAGSGTFNVTADNTLNILPTVSGAFLPTYADENGQLQTIYLEEWYKGRVYEEDGKQKKYSRRFFVHGTFETTDCRDIGPQVGDLDDVIPTMIVQSRKLNWYAQGGGASDMVSIDVDYAEPETPQNSGGDGEATYSLEFTAENEHIDLALSDQTVYGKQPEVGQERLINFDGETVGGVDIDAPIVEYSEIHDFTDDEFSVAYRTQLRDCIKKTNSAEWRGLEIGSVLFDGASAQKRGLRWYVTYRFRIRRGFTDQPFTILNQATPPAAETVKVTKQGWQYLWIKSENRPQGAGDNLKRIIAPSSIFVADVYDSIDFSVLDIGTSPLSIGFQ